MPKNFFERWHEHKKRRLDEYRKRRVLYEHGKLGKKRKGDMCGN